MNVRKNTHFFALRENRHSNRLLQDAFNRYGESAFTFAVIESDIHPSLIGERERFWIAHYNALQSGFNLANGTNASKKIVRAYTQSLRPKKQPKPKKEKLDTSYKLPPRNAKPIHPFAPPIAGETDGVYDKSTRGSVHSVEDSIDDTFEPINDKTGEAYWCVVGKHLVRASIAYLNEDTGHMCCPVCYARRGYFK